MGSIQEKSKNSEEIIDDTITKEEEKYYAASQWQLVWWRFKKHKMAIVTGLMLFIMYIVVIAPGFFAPYEPRERDGRHMYAPPTRVRLFDQEGNFHTRPFVYGVTQTIDPETYAHTYEINPEEKYPIYFFVSGATHKILGLWESNISLFGLEGDTRIALLGTDRMGRDLFSRTMYGAQISMSIGLIGVFLSLIIGIIFGGISGYFGGVLDNIIQRIIETLLSIPQIPLWMGLSAALPVGWPVIRVYFGITIILSLIGWTRVARVVRGKFLSLREEEFVLAAQFANASTIRIMGRHLLPSFMSHIIASITLAIPAMIIGETSLSFLGIGMVPPAISWGVLLQDAQNIQTVALYPWIMLPGLFVIVAVLCFNFLGDGIRDAADPYSS